MKPGGGEIAKAVNLQWCLWRWFSQFKVIFSKTLIRSKVLPNFIKQPNTLRSGFVAMCCMSEGMFSAMSRMYAVFLRSSYQGTCVYP
jgi:hypothetical protein